EPAADGTGLRVPVPDDIRGSAGTLRERERGRTCRVKSGTGLGLARLSILQDRIEIDGRADRRKRPRPTASHRVRHSGANRGSFLRGLRVYLVQKIFEILDCDSIACASSENSREIGIA